MTPEQRDVTRNALRKYGERHWRARRKTAAGKAPLMRASTTIRCTTPCGQTCYGCAFFEQRPEDEILEQLHIGRTTYQKALQDLLSTIAVYAAQRGAF